MPQFLSIGTHLPYCWSNCTQAVFNKYPNPFASHVLSSDVIDREFDPATGILTTTRLFLKKGVLPKWGKSLFNVKDAFIMEQSTVDPRSCTMVTVTRNLSHTKVMLVEETQTYTCVAIPIPAATATERLKAVAAKSTHPSPLSPATPFSNHTHLRTDVRIISNTGWDSIKSRIEGVGMAKFKDNIARGPKGLLHILEDLAHAQRGTPRP
ncbi:hypothetical protein HKX48_007077 [Thoreauomyces humboldtii]|nr:hypothetical protein HKX48_007077 [Thoreauomyces humboldtii]